MGQVFPLYTVVQNKEIQPPTCRKDTQGRTDTPVSFLLISVLDGSGWSISRPGLFNPGTRHSTRVVWDWVGLESGLDRCGMSRFPPPPLLGPKLRTVRSVASRHTYYAIPAAKAESKPAEEFEDKTRLRKTRRLENAHMMTCFVCLVKSNYKD
jgi:hypothetical protein